MHLNGKSMKPIYVQIAEAIEDDIISGVLAEETPCYSQVVVAKELGVNPATAGKGITHLVTSGVLEKQRGQAMMVVKGARAMIIERKKKEELGSVINELVNIAKKLHLEKDELLGEISRQFGEEE